MCQIAIQNSGKDGKGIRMTYDEQRIASSPENLCQRPSSRQPENRLLARPAKNGKNSGNKIGNTTPWLSISLLA